MGHGGYTLEFSLKDSVSAGLKDMGRALSNVRELVGSLRADVSALNKESGQAVSGLDLGKLAEGAADQLEGLSKGALQELDAAFRDSGKTMADYYAERRRQAGETADMERENALEQAERMAQELEARKDAYQAELEAFVAHGQNWAEAQQAQADREVSIKAEQAEREKAIDAQRLEGALSLAGGMADAMKQVYESGLAQSKGVYQLYQALAIAEATGIPARPEPRLREQCFGRYEGTPRDGAEFKISKTHFADRYSGGESMLQLAQRIYDLLDELRADESKTYLLVAHNGIARVVRSYFYDMTNEEYAAFGIRNCEFVEYTFE